MTEKTERLDGAVVLNEDDGCLKYSEIADIMTEMGDPMNHNTARNHILRAMRKFVRVFADTTRINIDETRVDEIASSLSFQRGIAELIGAGLTD